MRFKVTIEVVLDTEVYKTVKSGADAYDAVRLMISNREHFPSVELYPTCSTNIVKCERIE